MHRGPHARPAAAASRRRRDGGAACLAALTALLLTGTQGALGAEPVTPGSNPVFAAHLAWRVDPLVSCPDLRVAEDGPRAVAVFFVDVAGNPAHASVRVSSQSEQLDAAALRCVMKLRFQPATRPGDAEAVNSWQQMAFRWAAAETPAVNAARPAAAAQDGAVTLRVCANEAGELTQAPTLLRSAGDASLDAAALRIVTAGSGAYRPEATLNGKPLSGCAQVTIRFETR